MLASTCSASLASRERKFASPHDMPNAEPNAQVARRYVAATARAAMMAMAMAESQMREVTTGIVLRFANVPLGRAPKLRPPCEKAPSFARGTTELERETGLEPATSSLEG